MRSVVGQFEMEFRNALPALACDRLHREEPSDFQEPDNFHPLFDPIKHDLRQEERAVTIALGFLCTDGVVLATDTQYTAGGMKSQGPKLFNLFAAPILPRRDLAVLVAGAGRVPFMKRAVERIEEALRSLSNPTNHDVRETIEAILLQFYAQHVYPMPDYKQANADFQLIVGVWTRADGFGLYTTDETTINTVVRSSGHCSIGTGRPLSEYALDLICEPFITVENAKFAATLAIKAAKDYVGSCGGRTRIQALVESDSGCLFSRGMDSEVDDAEQQADTIFDITKYLLQYLDTDGVPDDESVLAMTDQLKEKIIQFRQKRKQQREQSRKRRFEAERRRLEKESGLKQPSTT